MQRALTALIVAVAMLALPAGALAQSAGDDQYVDPFQNDGGGRQEEPAPAPEEPAAPPEEPAAPPPAEPAPGGNGTASAEPSAEAAQETAPTLPRTGAPVILFAAAGYALLLAGLAIRRKT
jgi:LPXTG-motif cell wall-anchored protein